MRGADLLAQSLSNAGVDVIFSLSGNQIMPLYDACIDVGIRIIHTRHEGAAVYMAEAYAQLTGGIGVALITAAPGFASGLGPLFMATAAENPILLLSGDSPVTQDGKGAFQEFDQISVSAPLTKFAKRVMAAEDLGQDTIQAIRTALAGRPGPVHLALPFDVLNNDAGDATAPDAAAFQPSTVAPKADVISTIIDALEGAERPLILVGPSQNASRAGSTHTQLADALDTPVIPMESPRGLNDPSLGNLAAAIANADVIVSLGKDIDFTTGFGKAPKISAECAFYMIDPDPKFLNRAEAAMGSRMKLQACADTRVARDMLVEAGAAGSAHAAWRDEVAAFLASRPTLPKDATKTPMHPAVLCGALQKVLDGADDPILIIDGGEFGQWAQAFLSAPTRMINGPSGAIGGCLCYAFAAKIARPDATVVVVMGDGTVGFHFAEFETAHRYATDFIAVVGHDARWNAEYQIQARDFGPDRIFETELNPTRYDQAAMGFGCHGEYVTDPTDLDAALARAEKSSLPTCFVARIEGLPAPSGSGH
tara:strand:+ start:40946 stop:42556 length:1611 start_codon:yes stop_codon:yes gene_type:complete